MSKCHDPIKCTYDVIAYRSPEREWVILVECPHTGEVGMGETVDMARTDLLKRLEKKS